MSGDVLSQTIRLRASNEMVRAAETWAIGNGETLSGMVRRLLAKEVPGLPSDAAEAPFLDEAALLSDVLAGTLGATHRLLERAKSGTPEQKDALLTALVAYLVWEYRAPPDAAGVADMIAETARLMGAAD